MVLSFAQALSQCMTNTWSMKAEGHAEARRTDAEVAAGRLRLFRMEFAASKTCTQVSAKS